MRFKQAVGGRKPETLRRSLCGAPSISLVSADKARAGTTKHKLMVTKRFFKTIFARIAALMTLAMLPLGLIAVYQTRVVVEDARTLSSSALMARTVAAASKERELIKTALGAAEGVAAVMVEIDPSRCTAALDALVAEHPLVGAAVLKDADGNARCRSTFEAVDFSKGARFFEILERREPFVSLLPAKDLPGRFVVVVSQPILQDDKVDSVLLLSIPPYRTSSAMRSPENEEGLTLASVNLEGEIVSANTELTEAVRYLPDDIPLTYLPGRMNQTFVASSWNDEDRFYAIVPMIENALFLVGSWPVSVLPTTKSRLQDTMAVLFPLLMWAAGLGVALFGMRWVVTNHVAELRSAMRRYALGERDSTPLAMKNPPIEMEEAQRAFNRMAILLSEAEVRREQDLKDKEVLLREVHHRVKNNLQHIASLLNMQLRKTTSTEVRHILSGLNKRVRGLAVLHRSLFNTPSTATVDAAELVKAVIVDLQSSYDQRSKPVISTELASVDLLPDQAIPLSLLVAELLTEVLGDDSAGAPQIKVELDRLDQDRVRLIVKSDSVPSGADDGVGKMLINAFIRQLGGKGETGTEDARYVARVEFSRNEFAG